MNKLPILLLLLTACAVPKKKYIPFTEKERTCAQQCYAMWMQCDSGAHAAFNQHMSIAAGYQFEKCNARYNKCNESFCMLEPWENN